MRYPDTLRRHKLLIGWITVVTVFSVSLFGTVVFMDQWNSASETAYQNGLTKLAESGFTVTEGYPNYVNINNVTNNLADFIQTARAYNVQTIFWYSSGNYLPSYICFGYGNVCYYYFYANPSPWQITEGILLILGVSCAIIITSIGISSLRDRHKSRTVR